MPPDPKEPSASRPEPGAPAETGGAAKELPGVPKPADGAQPVKAVVPRPGASVAKPGAVPRPGAGIAKPDGLAKPEGLAKPVAATATPAAAAKPAAATAKPAAATAKPAAAAAKPAAAAAKPAAAAARPAAAAKPASAASEPELLERARGGEQAAFGQLVRLHQRRIYACAIHMLGDRGEAEDAVQETFVRAWKAIDRFDGRAELSTWLYRICINVSLNTLRRRKRVDAADISDPRVPEPAADPTQGQTDPRHAAQAMQLYGRLAKALDALSPSLRATVVLVLLDGMPQKEASEVLGCSEGTIAWRVHEARRRLRAVLGDHLEDGAEGADDAAGATATGRGA